MSRRGRGWRIGGAAAASALAASLAIVRVLAGFSGAASSELESGPSARKQAFFDGLPRIANIAHRGSSKQAPEHSLQALALAVTQGADVLELDLRVTADRKLVVSHDRTLERTAGLPIVIAQTNWPALQRDTGDQCPLLLDRVFEQFAGARLNLEMKDSRPEVPLTLLRAIERHGAADRVLVASFHTEMLEAFRRLSEGRVATSASMRESLRYLARDLLRLEPQMAFDALQVPALGWLGLTRRGFVERARSRGLAVHYWTVDDEAAMRGLVALGADGLMTNRPALLTRVLEALPEPPPGSLQPAVPRPEPR